MSVTITELARELNISHSTVSRVLKGRGHPEIANRIFALAHERGYTPNPHARCLKTGRSGIIGLVVGDFGTLLRLLCAGAAERSGEIRTPAHHLHHQLRQGAGAEMSGGPAAFSCGRGDLSALF